MKITLVSDTFVHHRGMDTEAYYLAKGLREKGHDVSIITSKTDFKGFNIKYHPIPKLRILSLRRINVEADAVISYSQTLGNFIKCESPFILVYGGFPFNIWKYKTLAKFEISKQIKKADKIVSISKFIKKQLKEEFGKDSKIIYPGIDTKIFRPMNLKKEFDFSTFTRGKRYVYKGEYLINKFSKKFEILKIHNWVKKDKLPIFYNRAKIFVSFSEWEGFGLGFAEAMSCGLPVIGLKRAAIPEVVNGYGVLCETIDEIEENIEKLLELSVEKRKEIGYKARKYTVKKFDYNIMVDKFERILKGL